jgi:hypothetical protein
VLVGVVATVLTMGFIVGARPSDGTKMRNGIVVSLAVCTPGNQRGGDVSSEDDYTDERAQSHLNHALFNDAFNLGKPSCRCMNPTRLWWSAESRASDSFLFQSRARVDAHGPPGGQPASYDRNGQQHSTDADEGGGVIGTYLVKKG